MEQIPSKPSARGDFNPCEFHAQKSNPLPKWAVSTIDSARLSFPSRTTPHHLLPALQPYTHITPSRTNIPTRQLSQIRPTRYTINITRRTPHTSMRAIGLQAHLAWFEIYTQIRIKLTGNVRARLERWVR